MERDVDESVGEGMDGSGRGVVQELAAGGVGDAAEHDGGDGPRLLRHCRAFAFSYDDATAPARVLNNAIKEYQAQ